MGIEIRELCKAFGDKTVLEHFSLSLPQRGIIGLFSPSGSGKTTLVHLLMGLIDPDAGEIQNDIPGGFSCCFQEDRLLPWETALQNVTLAAGVSREEGLKRLGELGLSAGEAQSLPGQLSGGMKRRVALCRALCKKAGCLVLDEPFNGLDDERKKGIYPLIRKRGEEGLVLLISHNREELTALCDAIIEMSGPPLTILTKK